MASALRDAGHLFEKTVLLRLCLAMTLKNSLKENFIENYLYFLYFKRNFLVKQIQTRIPFFGLFKAQVQGQLSIPRLQRQSPHGCSYILQSQKKSASGER